MVSDFDEAVLLLESVGMQKKAYQESKRELWKLDDVDVTVDEWPFLDPLVEVEGSSEETVRSASKRLGFDYSKALFVAITDIYARKFNISTEQINNKTPRIVFGEPNPFI